jgi:hypothetical protein
MKNLAFPPFGLIPSFGVGLLTPHDKRPLISPAPVSQRLALDPANDDPDKQRYDFRDNHSRHGLFFS